MQPLLRAPPFARVPAAIAAVSLAPEHAGPPLDAKRVESVLATVREARVGAEFWALPAPQTAATIVRAQAGMALPPNVSGSALWITDTRRDAAAMRRERQAVLAGPVDPWTLLGPGRTLIAHGDDEWVAVATILGAQVRLTGSGRFGALGDDNTQLRERVAAHLLACRYRDPFFDSPASLEDTVALLVTWRDLLHANRSIAVAAGMAWWKRAELRHFLWAPRRAPLKFLPPFPALRLAERAGGSVAVWPSRIPPAMLDAADRRGVTIVRIEDGFIRSAGLGADLVPPLSITVDRRGIHYDPSAPSDMEHMLETTHVSPALSARAERLRHAIVSRNIGKYGAAGDLALPARPPGRKLVLVTGQVEDDQSVLRGAGGIATNLALLKRARALEPDAEIWFRPHPDVDAGHRRGAIPDAVALRHADRVERGGSVGQLLGSVDAVHVLTSLAGFEALLRGCAVTCHGTPFYAGWGLTTDVGKVPTRRTRRLTLDELVAVTLILYPRYLDPKTMLPCSPEVLIARLSAPGRRKASWLVRLRRIQGRIAKWLRTIRQNGAGDR